MRKNQQSVTRITVAAATISLALFLCQGQGCPEGDVLSFALEELLSSLEDGLDQGDPCDHLPDGSLEQFECECEKFGDCDDEDFDDCPDNGTGCPDGDGDGVSDVFDACPDTGTDVLVDELGCPCASQDVCNDVDGDGVDDVVDSCPDSPPDAVVDEFGC